MKIEIKSSSKTNPNKPVEYYIDKNGCWICTSHSKSYGYPYITLNYKRKRLSRVIYEKFNGKILDGLVVMHICDNPNCINPNHLILGTSKQNSEDMVKKNRNQKGEQKKNSKLTNADVKFIRKCKIGATTLAKKYNVSQTLIKMVRNNKCWKHIL